MGVKQLTSFMKEFLPNGYKDVNIKDECKNKNKPTIVIDLHGLLKCLVKFDPKTGTKNDQQSDLEIIYGGRFKNYETNCRTFMKNLSTVAKLVFFVDGIFVDDKLDHWITRNNQRYQTQIDIMDLIYKGVKIVEIPSKLKRNCEIPRLTYHLKTIEVLAKEYGKIYKTTRKECDAEIAKFACENNVLAVLAEDSDFLIYEGDWKLFSLNDLNIFDLTTKEYNKTVLWDFLELKNTYEMSILSTMAGNDLIPFDDTKRLPSKLLRKNRYNLLEKFEGIARFIKNRLRDKTPEEVIRIVAQTINSKDFDRLKQNVENSLKMYDMSFELDSPSNELDEFPCKIFVELIRKRKPFKFSVLFNDFRYEKKLCIEAELKIFKKLIGIILNDENDFEIILMKEHNERYERNVIKPELWTLDKLPPLNEFTDCQKYPQYNELRWKVLKWILNVSQEDKIEAIPSKFLTDILILNFLHREKLLTVFEADLILLTILSVQEIDDSIEKIPEVLDKEAFKIPFLFTKFYQMVTWSLKLTGLKAFTKLIDFDGVIFHNMYYKYSKEKDDISYLLGDELVKWRIYAK